MMVWTMMRSLLTTAQKTPAGWSGTVLPLYGKEGGEELGRKKERMDERDVVTGDEGWYGRVEGGWLLRLLLKAVYGTDIRDDDGYVAREYKEKSDYAKD